MLLPTGDDVTLFSYVSRKRKMSSKSKETQQTPKEQKSSTLEEVFDTQNSPDQEILSNSSLPKPKKSFTDIPLWFAKCTAVQSTPEHGEPTINSENYDVPYIPLSQGQRVIRKRASQADLVFQTRNENTYKKLTASRRVSLADYVEINDNGVKTTVKESEWKSRPGAGSMMEKVSRLRQERKQEAEKLRQGNGQSLPLPIV